jgi:hypothetical protein
MRPVGYTKTQARQCAQRHADTSSSCKPANKTSSSAGLLVVHNKDATFPNCQSYRTSFLYAPLVALRKLPIVRSKDVWIENSNIARNSINIGL